MSDDTLEPDRVEGAPHPRDTRVLRGQAAAEAAFLDAVRSGRMHHGWLLTGPRGVGKATLAWRIARFLLAEAPADAGFFGAPPPPETLDVPPDHPIARRVAAQSEGRLKLIRRTADEKTGRLRSVITVDDVRGLKSFFHLSAGAEDTNAAALSELAAGSVGEAIRLANLDGVASYAALVALFAGIPRMDRPKALALVDSAGGRGAEARFDLMLTLIETFLARAARTGSLGAPPPEAVPGEAALLVRLAPDPAAGRSFADLQQTLGSRARRGKAVNLDPATLLLDMVLKIDETAGTLGPRAEVR